MNKKFLAAALGMAFAGLAQAQSNVTLYGVVDLGLQNYKTPNGSVWREQSGIQSGSRWGVRGFEDLGNGLKANFNLESGIKADDGSSDQGGLLFGRRATVGLQGGFGSVQLGRRDGPLFEMLTTVEPSGAGSNLGLNDLLSKGALTTTSGTTISSGYKRFYVRRLDNQIRYETPNLGGFAAQLMYSLGESNTTAGASKSLNNTIGANLTYANGPFYIGYGYQGTRDAAPSAATGLTAIDQTTQHKFNALGSSYDFQVVKLSGFYYTDKRDATISTTIGATTYAAAGAVDQRVYALGLSAPFGASTLAFQYGKIKDKVSRVTGAQDARTLGLNYLYSLSKRTNFYAGYTNINNKNYTGSGFTAYSDGQVDTTAISTATTSINAKSSAWSFGVRHQF